MAKSPSTVEKSPKPSSASQTQPAASQPGTERRSSGSVFVALPGMTSGQKANGNRPPKRPASEPDFPASAAAAANSEDSRPKPLPRRRESLNNGPIMVMSLGWR